MKVVFITQLSEFIRISKDNGNQDPAILYIILNEK